MDVLVDSSVWIDYFKSTTRATGLDKLLDDNLLVTNELILAELVPYLKLKKQAAVIKLLQEIRRVPLRIDWQGIIDLQAMCLNKGNNGIGIPDLIIAQNAKQCGCALYTQDKQLKELASVLKLTLY